MTIPIYINSKDYPTQNSADLQVDFKGSAIRLDKNKQYAISLVNALVPQSFRNISATLKNNLFYFSYDTHLDIPITIEDGQYNFDALLEVIEYKLIEAKAYIIVNDEKIFPFEININTAINKCYITLRKDKFENISVILNQPDHTTFGHLLGFTVNAIINDTLGQQTINLFPHNSVIISSNLIDVNMIKSDLYLPILHTEHFTTDAAFSNMSITQTRNIKYLINTSYTDKIDKFYVRLLYDDYSLYDTNSEAVSYYFIVEEI